MSVSIKGGDVLVRKLGEIVKKTERGATVNVGFLAGATYPDGTPVAAVAAWQEFGTKTIPARSFFRTMVKAKGPTWPDAVAKLLVANDYDVEKVLGLMGMGIKGQLQASIISVLAPPLSAITLMLRKMRADDPGLVVTGKTVAEAAARVAVGKSSAGVSTKPLIDTGHMINSVDYEVRT